MKNKYTSILFLLFFNSQIYCQTRIEEYNPIQKFVAATVQIPFMAKVANVQDVVNVRVTMNSENYPESYEVIKKLRNDCNLEALRVVKLISLKALNEELAGKKKLIIQVPFFTDEKVYFENGFVLNFFDKNLKPTDNDENVKYVRRYLVDTLSGIIKSDAEIFEYKKKNPVLSGYGLLKIDSSEKHSPVIFENIIDTLRIYRYSAYIKESVPIVVFSKFSNGQIASKSKLNVTYSYYPNGRIESETNFEENGNDKTATTFKWFANGQLAYLKTSQRVNELTIDKFVSVWDTLGKQIVIDGNGMDEYYDGGLKNMVAHSGLIKNGVKEGKWVGRNLSGKVEYIENFSNGICTKGISYLGKDSLSYNTIEEFADYRSGMNGFANHLVSNLKYPSDAQRANVSGKVYIQFVVCTDGTLCDYKVLKGIGFGCDEESVRVLQLSSGKWKPGKIRGRTIRSRFTIPINYQLSR
jgi:antitoxin component YwqK of YwqJK toxin-antitoxin module